MAILQEEALSDLLPSERVLIHRSADHVRRLVEYNFGVVLGAFSFATLPQSSN